jgi:hypothetical protein
MAEVAGEIHQPEAGIPRDLGGDEVAGLVPAAVVDEHGRPAEVGFGGEHALQPPKQFGQDGRFVEGRNDDGDGGCGIHGVYPAPILPRHVGRCLVVWPAAER